MDLPSNEEYLLLILYPIFISIALAFLSQYQLPTDFLILYCLSSLL